MELLRDHRLQALQRLDAWLQREEELLYDFLKQRGGAAASAAAVPEKTGIDPPPSTYLGPRLPLLVRPPAVHDSPPAVGEDEFADDTTQDFALYTERTNEGSMAFSDEPERGGSSMMSMDGGDECSEMQKPIAFGQQEPVGHCSSMLPMASPDARKSGLEQRRSRVSMRGSTATEFDVDVDEEPIWFFSDLKNKDVVEGTASGVLMQTLRRQGSRPKELTHQMHARIIRACGLVVASSTFELISGAAIILSVMCIGVEVEAMANSGGSSPVKLFLKDFEYLFTGFFLVELILRVGAEQRGICRSKQRYWILFDTFLVSSALVELIIGMLTDANSSNMMSIRIIRILRITRMIRVLRFVRVVRFVRALRVMVYSILNTLKSVVWAVILLFMVIYFFSIIFTQAAIENADGCTECEVRGPPRLLQGDSGSSMSDADKVIYYWGDLGVSMLTLFGCVIGGINWDEPMQGLASIHWFWLACFLFFILFTDFAILNVVTAAFCQGAMEGQQYDREQTVKDLLSNRSSDLYKTSDLFRNMFANLDTKGSGAISWKEFQTHIAEESVQALLALLELDNSDLFVLFRLLDVDGSDRLDAQEFVAGCMRLKGTARSIDLAKVSFENARLAKRLYSFMRFMKSEVTMLRSTVDALGGRLDGMGAMMLAPTSLPAARVSLFSNASLAFTEASRYSQMAEAAAVRRRSMQQPPGVPPGRPAPPPPKPLKLAGGDESESDSGSQLNVRMAVV